MRAGYQQGGGVGGCWSGVVRETHFVGAEFAEGDAHDFLLPAGEAFRS